MSDRDVVLSIIVNAIQLETQLAHEQSLSPSVEGSLSPEDRARIARTILSALSEQGFQVTRLPSEAR